MTSLAAPYKLDQGFLYVPLSALPNLPSKIKLAGRTYHTKTNFICTIAILPHIAAELKRRHEMTAFKADTRAQEAAIAAINRVKPSFDGYLNDVRLADLATENRHSLVVLARVSGLRELYAEVNRELDLELAPPPAHVTIAIADDAQPVPIGSSTDLLSRTTQLTEANRDELASQLDPYKTFAWSYFQSPVPVRNNLTLELHVPSFGPERDFYAQFGFEQIHYDAISGGGESDLGYFEIKREDSLGRTQLNFYGDNDSVANHARFNEFPPDTPRGYAVEVTIPVDDVEDLWERVGSKLAPATISQPLEIKRWGKRDFRVVDPFGFYIRFTEPVDWMQNR